MEQRARALHGVDVKSSDATARGCLTLADVVSVCGHAIALSSRGNQRDPNDEL